MANNEGRTCPKCGMNLGQKHLCPVCDKTEENTEPASNPAVDAGGNASSSSSREEDYIASVIGFMEKHLEDWDDEFNAFYDGLREKPDFDECFEACSQINEIFRIEMESGKISGSMTRDVMRRLRDVFPGLANEKARELALELLKKRLNAFCAFPGGDFIFKNLYRRATEEKDADAQKELGNCYYFGRGIEKNLEEAAKWWRRAAEQGHPGAQKNLGDCYFDGEGVKKDIKEAAKWWRRAAAQGVETAKISLLRLPKFRRTDSAPV